MWMKMVYSVTIYNNSNRLHLTSEVRNVNNIFVDYVGVQIAH